MFAIVLEIPRLAIPYLGPVLACQTITNYTWLQNTPNPPPPLYKLYPSVFYYEDPHHDWRCPVGAIPSDTTCPTERFSTIPGVLERYYGDCKDLATWRAAELWNQGETDARAIAVKASDPYLIHILVERPSKGLKEDPSRILGMGEFFAAKDAGRLKEFFDWRLGIARRMRPQGGLSVFSQNA